VRSSKPSRLREIVRRGKASDKTYAPDDGLGSGHADRRRCGMIGVWKTHSSRLFRYRQSTWVDRTYCLPKRLVVSNLRLGIFTSMAISRQHRHTSVVDCLYAWPYARRSSHTRSDFIQYWTPQDNERHMRRRDEQVATLDHAVSPVRQ